MKRFLAAALLAFGLAGSAVAQNAPPTPPPVSVLSGQVSLAVSNVSSRVALPSAAVSATALTVANTGLTDAYIATGTVAIVATSGGTCATGTSGPSCRIPAGTSISFYTRDAYIAAITASSTTTLVIYQGTGPVSLRMNGAGGGSGTVNSGTTPDVAYYATSGSAVSDGGAAQVKIGGVTLPSTSPSGVVLCNTADCTTNYEKLTAAWSGNVAQILTSNGGTGTLRSLKLAAGTANIETILGTVNALGGIQLDGGNATAGTAGVGILGTYAASSGVQAVLQIKPTINQSSTAGYTALYVYPTESTTGSGAKLLIDAGVGSTSKFSVDDTGSIALTNAAQISINTGAFYANGSGVGLASNGVYHFSSGTNGGTAIDSGISRDSTLGAGNFDFGNGTANDKSGTLNLANLVASGDVQSGSGNKVKIGLRGGMSANGDGLIMLSNNAGTDFSVLQLGGQTNAFPGLARSGVTVHARFADNSGDTALVASYLKTGATTVSALPSAATVGSGSRYFVTDATACTFGSAPTGGAAVSCPVYSDGTNWKEG